MAQTPAEKIKQQTPPVVKSVPYDPDRLHMSRDEVIAKDKKMQEIEAKLEIERKKLEEAYEAEQEALENLGKKQLESAIPSKKKQATEEE